jgi:alpha-1,3-glucan synthase
MHAFSTAGYDGPLRHDPPGLNTPVLTRLQVAMSREIGGWPVYTIITALGQVCAFPRVRCSS